MLTDTHCHLSQGRFRRDLSEVIGRAREAGVTRMICPAEDLVDAKCIGEIACKYEGVWGAAGFYPGRVKVSTNNQTPNNKQAQILNNQNQIMKLRQFVEQNRNWVVGIGEIGLDKYWLGRQRELEIEMFRAQMELAAQMGRPVVIHNREAEDEIREVMEGLAALPRGQFHCWSGSDEFLEYVLDRDFYVGFCGNVTYPKNEKLREQAKRVPKERLLLETDSPYLPPNGKRGERNEPANVRITAEFLASLRGVCLKALARQTSKNAERLFGI